MSPRARTLIGLLIAAIGVALAWVAYERSFRRPAPSAGPAPVVLSTATKARLDAIQIDARPTDETAASLIEQAVDRARMLAEQTPGLSARAGDLADAFRERGAGDRGFRAQCGGPFLARVSVAARWRSGGLGAPHAGHAPDGLRD
jgi:hypothetical protein